MKFMPHEYQKYAIEYIKSHPVTALFLDMGLGKTVTTLTAIRDLMYDTLPVPSWSAACQNGEEPCSRMRISIL